MHFLDLQIPTKIKHEPKHLNWCIVRLKLKRHNASALSAPLLSLSQIAKSQVKHESKALCVRVWSICKRCWVKIMGWWRACADMLYVSMSVCCVARRINVQKITIKEQKDPRLNRRCHSRHMMLPFHSYLQSHHLYQNLMQTMSSNFCRAPMHGNAFRQDSCQMHQVVPIQERNCDAWKHCSRSCWMQCCFMLFFFPINEYKIQIKMWPDGFGLIQEAPTHTESAWVTVGEK
jgi:hypothetical protein